MCRSWQPLWTVTFRRRGVQVLVDHPRLAKTTTAAAAALGGGYQRHMRPWLIEIYPVAQT